MSASNTDLPLVYSCSGCSSAAQLANHLALRLDREGVAEMSCIAGVGGNVRSLVRRARDAASEGRPIVAIDGCMLACARSCLAERGVTAIDHVMLAKTGVAKKYHADFDAAQAEQIYPLLVERIQSLNRGAGPGLS
ncbi:putative zinc-binding protein [Roseateles toxinivorans]|uniref:Putative metal-binding protein n=1 Tax=Roseateles toxinivorans TaxID=270368 RepID=A0A4R6QMB7_9BURK|nr:putative zinc-binding protein [Roseateles toxinivorans]TDP71250.1 putative metal-binding protein [Roseateles toxinivorans]